MNHWNIDLNWNNLCHKIVTPVASHVINYVTGVTLKCRKYCKKIVKIVWFLINSLVDVWVGRWQGALLNSPSFGYCKNSASESLPRKQTSACPNFLKCAGALEFCNPLLLWKHTRQPKRKGGFISSWILDQNGLKKWALSTSDQEKGGQKWNQRRSSS